VTVMAMLAVLFKEEVEHWKPPRLADGPPIIFTVPETPAVPYWQFPTE